MIDGGPRATRLLIYAVAAIMIAGLLAIVVFYPRQPDLSTTGAAPGSPSAPAAPAR